MIKSTLILAISLSLDAFGVALGIGCGQDLNFKEKLSLSFSFGFFQFLLALIGGILGGFIANYIFDVSSSLGGLIILIIGILFIKDGLEKEKECLDYKLDLWKYALLGISVSIDALGVGFSILHQYSISMIATSSLLIGLIASTFTLIAVFTVKYIKSLALLKKYSGYVGGIILILSGIVMIAG
ncbi:manganese efflux pump MntP family protein [Natroniella acetigena]|uniref:manganese efflux pump MntP n=1 Tax=Natroniella acetigena TaxID=52004 RepID=UPI00200AEFFC|nr:manganese efflux pump [Natroniella acetigena]MCK8827623.1 manganese efflux pump MntP family protein [Natroniella acetigena]